MADIYFRNRVFREEIIKSVESASKINGRREHRINVDESLKMDGAAAQVQSVCSFKQSFGLQNFQRMRVEEGFFSASTCWQTPGRKIGATDIRFQKVFR